MSNLLRPTYDLTRDSQVSRAAQELVRMIHVRDLKPEDRLPPQSEILNELAFSNDTVNLAMRSLVSGGIVRRKPRVGTVVVDPNRPLKGLWSVGIATFPSATTESYYMQLLYRIQFHLDVEGCGSSLHILRESTGEGIPALKDFGNLEQEIAERRINAVVTLGFFDTSDCEQAKAMKVPIIHVGAWENAPAGVVIDQGPMVKGAVELLIHRGCQRIADVSPAPAAGFCRGWKAYQRAIARTGPGKQNTRHIVAGSGSRGGWQAAETLLAMPESERPDGLVVHNDWVGMGLTARLAKAGDYRPAITVQTNRQAPLAFALPVIHFELDVEEIARRGAAMLIQRMRDPRVEDTVEWVRPRLAIADPSHLMEAPQLSVA